MINEHNDLRPVAGPAELTELEIIDEVAGLISSWFVRKDQKYFDIDLPDTPLSKADIERISLFRLYERYGPNYLNRETLSRAFRKAIDERHADHRLSIPVWSGERVCQPGDMNRVIWVNGYVHLNTWRSPSYRQLVADVEPDYGVAAEFFEWLLPREVERNVFLDWLAWCLQHEDDKPMWAPFLYSKTKGSGKSTACQLAVRLFGEDNTVTQNSVDKLVARFNLPLLHAKLVISEELKLRPDSSQGNTLKTYITERSTVAEHKGREAKQVRQSCCFLFTTNHLPLWIEPDDRRYYVIEVDHDGHAAGPRAAAFSGLVERLHRMLDDDRAVAALYRALLERQLGDDFNAKSLNVERFATDVMRRIHGASRQTTIDQLEEFLDARRLHAIPEGNVAKVVHEQLKTNLNSTKHLMSELGWTKSKVKWGGVDYSRAIWVRPGFSIEGGVLFGDDRTQEPLVDHLTKLDPAPLGFDV
ncbi:primase-helicase family protein [Roseicyclus marinus]|uniref:primase-helicase family protein n=1 Tax=Roseicyclus marinus TaxID=2161673 RepID=UPI0024E12A2E|nr:DUF5906 domain-containing protein [Roseicyclus marinus]